MASILRWAILALALARPALADDVSTFQLPNGLDVVVIDNDQVPAGVLALAD